MIKEVLQTLSDVEIFPISTMILFILLFVGIIVWVFKKDGKYIEKMKNLPIENNEQEI